MDMWPGSAGGVEEMVAMGPGGWMWAGHGWGMALGGVALLVLWVGVLAAVLAVLGTRRGTPGPTALQVLDERLARGDIGVEEYSARRRQIVDGH